MRYRVLVNLGTHEMRVVIEAPSEEAALSKARTLRDGFMERGCTNGILTRESQARISRGDLNRLEGP
jgi:hypothetical protein